MALPHTFLSSYFPRLKRFPTDVSFIKFYISVNMLYVGELEIEELTKEIASLKTKLKEKERRLRKLIDKNSQNDYGSKFSATEISRYSRQMLVPSIGIFGQVALKNSKVLVVGAGGLGCPASLYLAAAGVGHITIIDNDEVDLTNLHRQILHSEDDLNTAKVISAFNTLSSINSNIKIVPIHMHVNGESLKKLLEENSYDVVVDGTDNVATRYLLNDMCVLNKIPLVSGSALQLEGQLTVYNYEGGPCYRCLFPIPPPPSAVTSCGDGGVLGVVPGLIGVLEALEVIKIVTKIPGVLTGRLLIFDGGDTSFRNIKLRRKNVNCEVCGDNRTIDGPIDYEQFCNSKANDKVINIDILESKENISVQDFVRLSKDKVFLLDVRPNLEYAMCHLPNSWNIPYLSIEKGEGLDDIKKKIAEDTVSGLSNVYVICRRGNDSQRAVSVLKKKFATRPVTFVNIEGGLHAYSKVIDPSFPIY